jgi:hypothetical protein
VEAEPEPSVLLMDPKTGNFIPRQTSAMSVVTTGMAIVMLMCSSW